ncbi:MAG: hypothetical protein M5R41_00470 [Bacteroidia bacterium]|nr:hypothetical protein [Bacteroidia bacterium]
MKMNIRITLIVLLALCGSAAAQPTLTERRDSVISFWTNHETTNNHAAAVARILSRNDSAVQYGMDMLRSLSAMATPDIIERFRLTTAYVLLRNTMADDVRQDIEMVWTELPVRPFEAEHERVCYFAALHLSTLYFGDSAVWFNGRTRQENQDESKAFLLHWMREVTEAGQEEFDSPTYGAAVFNALLLLRDHAIDDGLRKRAELMAQWLLADFAHEYLVGAYAGAHAREHMLSAMQPITSDMSSIGWLYFGDGTRLYSRDQYFAALSDFEPLPEIVDIATHRQEPYEAWEQKPRRKPLRDNGLTGNGPVWKYTYMDPLYAIGSIDGGLIQHREQHTWDVTWIPDNPEKSATLFLMQPYSDANSLTPFLPHSEELALRSTAILDPYHGTVTKIVGGSPFEDVFQYKNTLIALYDIGTVTRFPVLTGFLPPDVKALDIDSVKSGWITINTGDVYIALYPFKRYRMAEGHFGRHMISYERRNGAIVQVAGRNVVGPYEQFVRRIKASKVDASRLDSDMSIRYITIFGDTLSMAYEGSRTVNGEVLPHPPKNLLFSSPRLSCEKGSGALTVRGKDSDVVIDMRKMETNRTRRQK